MVDSNTRQAKRTPVTLKVKFKSETLEQFIERYAVDVSQGGIFIRTKEPQPVGTQMKFEFQLRDGAPLIGGEGTVVWIRELDPSRPAVAPGMGVRFDRLSDGSSTVLEQILNRKSRLSSSVGKPLSKPPAFNEIPTRVAHMPLGDEDRETTPLPSPMPFHSDADEFPDEAFEEATKVRSVEELVAQTAMGGDLFAPRGASSRPSAPPPSRAIASGGAASSMASGALSSSGSGHVVANLASGVIEDPPEDFDEDLDDPQDAPQPLRTLIESVPPPPMVGGAARTLLDAGGPTGRTLLDAAPPPPAALAQHAAMNASPSSVGMSPPSSAREDSRPRSLDSISPPMTASAANAAGAREHTRTREPSRPPATAAPLSSAPLSGSPMVARPVQGESKMTTLIIALVCVLAAAVALVWFLVIKKNAAEPTTAPTTTAPVTPVPTANDPVTPNPATTPGTDGGVAAVVPTPETGAELAETSIEADYPNANVEVQGTDQTGKAPLVAKLTKGKSYSVKVTAPGYITSELTVIGGNDNKIPVKLDPKMRVIQVGSTPPKSSVYIDGVAVKQQTPTTVELTKAQLGKKIRVMVRRIGFQPFFVTVKPEDFAEETDRMVFVVNAAMTAATRPVVAPGGGDNGGDTGGEDPGAAGGSTEPKPAEPKPAEPKPEPAAGGEPAPDWTKNQ